MHLLQNLTRVRRCYPKRYDSRTVQWCQGVINLLYEVKDKMVEEKRGKERGSRWYVAVLREE